MHVLRIHGIHSIHGSTVFGRFGLVFRWCSVFLGSVANDLMFLFVQVRLLIPATVQLRVLYLCMCMCILTVSKLQFRQREARLRTRCFWLGFRWCLAFSDPLPTTSCFCLCRFAVAYTCYGPITCPLPGYVYFNGFEAAVSAARGRTVFGSDLDGLFGSVATTTSCFCLCRFGCYYTCYTVQLHVLYLCITCPLPVYFNAVSAA